MIFLGCVEFQLWSDHEYVQAVEFVSIQNDDEH